MMETQRLIFYPRWLYVVLILVPMIFITGCGTLNSFEGLSSTESNIGEQEKQSPADVYVQLAIAYMKRQKFAQALQNAKNGLAQDSGSAAAHNVIALIYDHLGELRDAEKHFRRAVSLQPKNPFYRNAFGFYLCKQKRYESADKEFVAALRNPLYNSPQVALSNAGLCALRNGKVQKSEQYFLKALRQQPTLATPLIEMSALSFSQNKTVLARDYLRRFHKVSAQTSRSLWLGIRAARVMGDQNTMASFELKLRSNFPDSKEYRLLRGFSFQ